jgi:putative FmdB family regulatory protein
MPIFEYQCKDCNSKYEILHKTSERNDEIICPDCHSKNHIKLISTFSAAFSSNSDFGSSCPDGSCGMNYGGGCANGMCGLN